MPLRGHAAFSSLRDTLRSATAGAHAALDNALLPTGTRWTRERYIAFLQATLAVVGAAEPAVAAVLPAFAPFGETTRASRLRDDLIALGQESLGPRSAAFASLHGAAAAYGTAYVIEGSQLGGRVIAGHVADALALGDDGLGYLRPPGMPAGARWKAFVSDLDAFGRSASERDVSVAAAWASHTFRAFEAAFRDEGLI
jgi:heme oxygenase